MRAAILRSTNQTGPFGVTRPLSIEDVALDAPGHGELRVRIRAAGVCHSDLSVVNGDRARPTPMVLGHEGAGVVEELGPGVDDIAVGDHVVLVFVPSCGACIPCLSGRPALCEPAAVANGAGALLGGHRRLRQGDARLHHHLGVSCFAEQAVVSRRSVVRIDQEVPFEHAALFGCAVLTGMGAVIHTGRTSAGASVAVVGLGGVGAAAVLAAVVSGARRIVVVDREPSKLALGLSLGATDAFDARDDDVVARIRDATGGGVEEAYETAGSVAALDLAYRITRRGGTTVTAGLSHPDRTFALPHLSLVAEERTLKGSYIGSSVPVRDIPRYVALFRAGKLPVDRLLSSTLPLDEVNHALEELDAGRAVRQVLTP